MSQPIQPYSDAGSIVERLPALESSHSAVSWSAVLGGAVVAVAVTFLLLALGTGIGLTSISPWSGNSPSASTFTVSSAIGLIVVQWLSSGLGGYLTGRLRTTWTGTHSHEVFFRDTANGFLTWAIASVAIICILASAGAAALGGATHAAATAASGIVYMAQNTAPEGRGSYLLDALFRPAQPTVIASAPVATAEAARILTTSLSNGSMAPEDRTYLASVVAVRAGIAQADAEKRVDDLMVKAQMANAKVKRAAENARKAAASASFFTFFSMLIGAFIASAAAALGGRERDEIALRPLE